MANISKLFKSAGVYFLGNVMTRLISFFLLPLYTKYIAADDLGFFDVSTSYLNVLIPVICLEIWSGIMRFIFDFDNFEDKYKVIFNGMVIFSISVAIYSLLFFILGIVTNIQSIMLIFIYGFFLMLQNLYTYLARGLNFNQAFAVSGIINSLVNSISNIIMILVFGMKLNSLYISMILGLFVQVVILESKVKIVHNISLNLFDKNLVYSMVRFSLPLCLNSACFWFLSSYNKIGISNTLGLEANGIYTVAGKFTMMIAIVANCFSLAWQEMVYSLGNEKNNKGKFYSSASNYCITSLLLGTLLVIPIIHIIFPFFVDEAYSIAYPLIPLYMFATAISTFSSFLGNIFGAEKKTEVIFYSTIIAAIVNVSLFHFLVNYIGIEAANVGLTVGYSINIIIRLSILKKDFLIKIDYSKIIFVLLLNIPVIYIYLTQSTIINMLAFIVVSLVSIVMYRRIIVKILISIKCKLTH